MKRGNASCFVIKRGEENMKISYEYVFFFFFACRGSTREKALASIIEAFSSSLQHEFVEKKYSPFLPIVCSLML